MNFVVVTEIWLNEHGIAPNGTWRASKNGDRYLVHEDYLLPLVDTSTVGEGGELSAQSLGLETYPHNSSALRELLASNDWTSDDSDTFNL